jgi:beta-galactosidase
LSYDPATFGKTEFLSMWGFTAARACWNWPGQEGKPVRLAVYSGAQEVELLVGGVSLGRKKAGEALAAGMPKSFVFDAVYTPGTVEAISYTDGKEASRGMLRTAGEPAAIRLVAEKESVPADGHALIYVSAQIVDSDGNIVPDAENKLTAQLEGEGLVLTAFGSGNPLTAENYTAGRFRAYRGLALAILRAGYTPGDARLTVCADGLPSVQITVKAL